MILGTPVTDYFLTVLESTIRLTGVSLRVCENLGAEASPQRCASSPGCEGKHSLWGHLQMALSLWITATHSLWKNSARWERAGILWIQGNFHTVNTISSLFENLLITNLGLEPSLKKKVPRSYAKLFPEPSDNIFLPEVAGLLPFLPGQIRGLSGLTFLDSSIPDMSHRFLKRLRGNIPSI